MKHCLLYNYRLGKCSVLFTENITPLEECTKATRPPIEGGEDRK